MDKHAIYRHQGLGGTSGIGRRCGLVLVDFVNGFVDFDQLGGPHIEAAAQGRTTFKSVTGVVTFFFNLKVAPRSAADFEL